MMERSLHCNLNSFGEKSSDQTQNLQDLLTRLEEEKLKIDAFKRELPLCMQLLNNAMEASKQDLKSYKENEGARPVLEEFIPLKTPAGVEGAEKKENGGDKANWMTSAQLWSPGNGGTTSPKVVGSLDINGGAFLPFSKDKNSTTLALSSSDNHQHKVATEDKENVKKQLVDQQKEGDSPTTNRKARRCWSPDLHRRFVNALHLLGGSQVATPKQIRELMKVDGLTNDEVKSHLQKYRLHTRRPSPSPQPSLGTAQPVVFLGGILVPPEYTTAAHGGALYAAHHYCAPQVQEFYGTQQSVFHQSNPIHHQQLHMYKPPPHSLTTESSPESNACPTADRSESIEDGKSDSSSWKVDSRGETKALALREERGESNKVRLL